MHKKRDRTDNDSIEVKALDKNPTFEWLRIRAESLYKSLLAQRSRLDLGETLSKNFSNGLIKPMQELIKSVTKISSKVHKPKTYNEAVNNLINRNKW